MDEQRKVIVMSHAPTDWVDWKSQLLTDRPDPLVAQQVGKLIGTWHSVSALGMGPEQSWFERPDDFAQLRVNPYYRATMATAPEVARPMGAVVDRMLSEHRCLVHGDLSPKNVLVGPAGLWVIDFEVANIGDPVFDLAFVLTHLLLKSIHRPQVSADLDSCAEAFLGAYLRAIPADLYPDLEYLTQQVACLVLARVKGKSPAEYLTPREASLAWQIGKLLIFDPSGGPASVAVIRENVANQ